VYISVLTIHSWMRWVTLLVAAAATIQAFRAPAEGGSRSTGWDKYLMLAVDLQALFGLILYFGLSPYTTEAMSDVGSVVRTPAVRYWAVVHAGAMFGAVILVRVGRVLALNASSGARARSRRVVCFALATAIMLAAIPWPGLTTGRPLFRVGWRRIAVSQGVSTRESRQVRVSAPPRLSESRPDVKLFSSRE
jgi:hypothetical protein